MASTKIELVLAAASLVVAGVANAQTASASPAPSPSSAGQASGNTLGEIVVTAQKRRESAFTVPLSITVLDEKRIELLGLVSTDDYLRQVPSVTIQRSNAYPRGGIIPVIRGVQVGDVATTALYLDELPIQPLAYTRIQLPIQASST